MPTLSLLKNITVILCGVFLSHAAISVHAVPSVGFFEVYTYEFHVFAETDKRGTTTTHTYDKLDRIISSHKPAGSGPPIRLFFNEYDAEGNLIAVTDANGNREQYEYDHRHLKINTLHADGATMSMVYDGNHNETQRTDEVGQTTRYEYDAANRLLSITNAAEEATQYIYDLNNNRTRVTRPQGNTFRYVYDFLNRNTQIVDALGGTTHYEYDGNDNVVRQIDANNNVVTYAYDALDRRITHTQHKQSGNLVTRMEYDKEDNEIAVIDAKGQRFEYDYDDINRNTDIRYPNIASAYYQPVRTNLGYDANNNVISINDFKLNDSGNNITETYTRSYDLLDRQISDTQRGYVITTTYDDNGNKTSVSSAGGSTNYSFDARNRLHTATQNGQQTTYSYRGDNLQTKVAYPNGTETNYSYDSANRTLSVTNQTNTNQTLISAYQYIYDQNGNRIEQREQQPSMVTASRSTTYTYDHNDRMLSYTETNTVTNESLQLNYQYDAAYNRTRESETSTTDNSSSTRIKTYTYDDTHWLTGITEDNQQTIAYLYDANGNTLQKTDNLNNHITHFFYDSRNQLVQLTRGPPGSETNQGNYNYDYRGIRVRHSGSERGDVEYYHDGTSIIDEYDVQGCSSANCSANANLLAHYNYADRLLSLKTPTDTQFYHYSALRTTTNLSNSAGSTQVSYQTNPWGEITEQQGTSVNRQIFTGQEHDENTGLIYFGARYYDSDIARFITQDSYLGEYGTPPSLHRYLYAYGNPTIYIDENGNFAITDWLANQLNRSAEIQRNYADKQTMQGDGFWSDAAIQSKKVGARFSSGMAEGFAFGTRVLDVAVDGVLTTFGDREILGQNSYQRTEGRRDATIEFGNKVKGYATQDDLASALMRDGKGVYHSVEAYGGKLINGDADAWAGAGAFSMDLLTGALIAKASHLGKAKKLSKIDAEIDGTFEKLNGPLDGLGQRSGENASVAVRQDVMQSGSGKIRGQIGAVGDTKKTKLVANRGVASYETPFKPLSKNQRANLREKVEARTATKREVQQLDWDRRFSNRRATGVRRFWSEERARLRAGEQGTRNWSPEQSEAILSGKRPKFNGQTVEGHHKHNALDHPQIANDAKNIHPATKDEHLQRWHGGNFQNKTNGKPLNPDYPEEF